MGARPTVSTATAAQMARVVATELTPRVARGADVGLPSGLDPVRPLPGTLDPFSPTVRATPRCHHRAAAGR